jgi:hypothetical protein
MLAERGQGRCSGASLQAVFLPLLTRWRYGSAATPKDKPQSREERKVSRSAVGCSALWHCTITPDRPYDAMRTHIGSYFRREANSRRTFSLSSQILTGCCACIFLWHGLHTAIIGSKSSPAKTRGR